MVEVCGSIESMPYTDVKVSVLDGNLADQFHATRQAVPALYRIFPHVMAQKSLDKSNAYLRIQAHGIFNSAHHKKLV